MHYYGKKIVWYFLKLLVYVKRAAVWFLGTVFVFLQKLFSIFHRLFGIRFFKHTYRVRRVLKTILGEGNNRFLLLVGRREFLQIVLFVIGFVALIPHSTLYAQKVGVIPGRQTMLYRVLGPGDQDYGIEEFSADFSSQPIQNNSSEWRAGAIRSDSGRAGEPVAAEPIQVSTNRPGGGVITKPVIAPGALLPNSSGAPASSRSDIVEYVVQPGDTVGAIATQYDISVETILVANNLTTRSYIRPGDTLVILPTNGVVHKVKSGDSVSRIARLYDAKAEDIISFNRLRGDGADIVIGEVLVVPGGTVPQAQPVYRPPAQTTNAFRQVAAPPPSVEAPAGAGYLWPAGVRTITQYFGIRHTGLDIAGPIGTSVYASRGGTVIKSQCGWNGGYGCYIIIDHGGGVHTLYGHNSKLLVSVGDTVDQGQVISLMGSTGRSTGPHVHFEVRINGQRVNPLRYIR